MFIFFRKLKLNLLYLISKQDKLYYLNRYASYEEAELASKKYGDAYQADNIMKTVAQATEQVRRGEALYEEDGVVFFSENNNYELLSSLMYVACLQGSLKVIDFGGALGSTYFRYRKHLDAINAQWQVVEQKKFVEYGRENIPELRFWDNLDDCKTEEADIVLISSVLGYLADPYSCLRDVLQCGVPYVIIDKTAFTSDDTHVIAMQHVPDSIYRATYPVQLLSQTELLGFIKQQRRSAGCFA